MIWNQRFCSLRRIALLLAVTASSTRTTSTAGAFTLVPPTTASRSSYVTNTPLLMSDSWSGSSSSSGGGGAGQMEQIIFKIHADGRVEETVRGVKGNNCHQVTEKINQALGEVVSTQPTEELYEQEVVVDQTLTQNDGGDSSSSWEGGSTW